MSAIFRKGIDLNGQRAVNAADPTSATDLVTKQYADQLVYGVSDLKDPVKGTTTANLAFTALVNGLVHDGVTYATGDRILLKNQTTGSENGIYVIAASGSGARSTDADTSAEVTTGMATTVLTGTTKGTGGTQANPVTYILTNTGAITIGTTSLTFSPIGGVAAAGTTYVAGAGLAESPAGTFNIGAGNGITVNADDIQVNPSVVVRKFAANCVATTNPQTFAHGLGSADVDVTIKRTSDNSIVYTDVTVDATNVTVDWGAAPAAGEYRVVAHS